jgi:alpha-amylase/alpha-mannosidase (GH57 family)
MTHAKTLDLVFLWHMHQPDYRDPETGEYAAPWVYLHALKDYTDMAAHFERHPRAHAVVNFAPILLEQIDDYCQQFESGAFRDPLLRLLGHENLDALSAAERALVFEQCFHANRSTMIDPFPQYRRLRDLYERADSTGPAALGYFSGAMLGDLLTWYHLAWTGETERRGRALVAELLAKGEGFTLDERLRLRSLIGEVLHSIVPRYRALAARGQLELSATPYSHPLAPLLIDFASAHDALPDAPLPHAAGYPGGRERVRAHLALAMASHAERFGEVPAGIWPSEGAVSGPLIELLAETRCGWAATGASVLANSLGAAGTAGDAYHGYRLDGAERPALFFRDERLSDLIGFEYSTWNGKDAAAHFVGELIAIPSEPGSSTPPLASVILDGENAWEHFPFNGYYFFEELYRLLAAHQDIRTTTYRKWLAANSAALRPLARLVSGSWVHGSFSTWIGSPDKNRAWDLLSAAKSAYDRSAAHLSAEARERAGKILLGCESSDWFWWFGDQHPARAVSAFDKLFRSNLRALYRALGEEPPASLFEPVSRGKAADAPVATMLRAS